MSNIELIQYSEEESDYGIKKPKIDGECISKLYEHMLLGGMRPDNITHIFSNAYKVLSYLVNPYLKTSKKNRVLCLGKVQSGKTAFFISSIALSFDNGYNLAYVIGGTKTKLKEQNYERLCSEFLNNEKIKILSVDKNLTEDPRELIEKGFKVILVALKNVSSDTANLGVVEYYSNLLRDIPSLIIDDEGDECSPGAPKLKSKNSKAGRTHDVLSDILENIDICTFLSVTATPQANFLISTIDSLSPDFALLVEPGYGYTGGNSFHDTFDNKHVIEIKDSDCFEYSIPETFKSSLYFFIFSILTQKSRKINEPYSMLVHPSSLTKVQTMVVEKIRDFLEYIRNILLNSKNISFEQIYELIYISGKDSVNDFSDFSDFKHKTSDYIVEILNQMCVYEFNVSATGRQSIEEEQMNLYKYKIYVGGNMLGRGLTIKNLNVTYIYRDSKVTQIDTLYQRARWFGYKSSYFDICRVYMTKELKEKFIDTVENENDMWTSINSFLLTKTDIKKFPRIFTLNNEKLRLTRASVAKTIVVDRVNPGYDYDRTIALTNEQKSYNRSLYNSLLTKYEKVGQPVQFGSSVTQTHFIVELAYTEFFDEFISKYIFPRGSKFGIKSFEKLLEQVKQGSYENKIQVVFMRYKTGEYRTPISNGNAIKELPQSYDNGTGYPGDKKLTGFEKELHIQLHPVYIDKEAPENIIPIIALNNPITAFNVRYVTGDNYYEEV